MAYFIAAYITKQRFTVLTKKGGGDHQRRLSRVHYICTMHCVQCTLEKQCTAHHVIIPSKGLQQNNAIHYKIVLIMVLLDKYIWAWRKPPTSYKQFVNVWMSHISLRLVNAICDQRAWSTLVLPIACCLTAPGHYLNKWWLTSSEVWWHSEKCNR